MAEVDTSSYPKPPGPVNVLDTAAKFGNLQQQKQQIESSALGIDKQKLDLVNQRFSQMAKGMTALANDPDLTEDKIKTYTQDLVKIGFIPPEMAATFIKTIPSTQGMDAAKRNAVLKGTLEQHLAQAQTISDAINFQYGQQGMLATGNAQQPIATSPKFGTRSTGLPIAIQQPPGTSEFSETGQQYYRGVQPPVSAPGMVTAPPMREGLPVQPPATTPTGPITNPAIQGQSSNFGGNVLSAVAEPPTFNERFQGARGGMSAPPPLFEEGKKQLVEDQNIATAKMQAVKPAIQALKLMPGLQTGPGTQQFNDLVAAAKAWGIVDTKAESDPTVLRQEVEKKLAQYVGNSPVAARSDAAQVLAEAGSPNPKKQILPALQQLTRDAIILDRVEAARPNAFEGSKFQEYGKHRSTFPQSIDERAFGIDLMEPEKAQALVKKMAAKYEKNPRDTEALKFFKSLDIAKKQGFFSGQ